MQKYYTELSSIPMAWNGKVIMHQLKSIAGFTEQYRLLIKETSNKKGANNRKSDCTLLFGCHATSNHIYSIKLMCHR